VIWARSCWPGPVAASAPVTNYQPVDALNPYSSNFTIKVRVTAKSDVRTWSNARSSGKVFSVDLIDENVRVHGTPCHRVLWAAF